MATLLSATYVLQLRQLATKQTNSLSGTCNDFCLTDAKANVSTAPSLSGEWNLRGLKENIERVGVEGVKKNRMRRNKNRRKWVGTGGVWKHDKTLERLGTCFVMTNWATDRKTTLNIFILWIFFCRIFWIFFQCLFDVSLKARSPISPTSFTVRRLPSTLGVISQNFWDF